MPIRKVTGELDTFAAIVQASSQTGLWASDGAAGAETVIVPPITKPAPDFAWSAEDGYGDTQDWPEPDAHEDEDEDEDEVWQRQWRRVRGIAVLVLLCAAVMTGIILLAGQPDPSSPALTPDAAAAPPVVAPTVTSTPPPVTVTVAPPPPVTVTRAAPPPDVSPPVPVVDGAQEAKNMSDQLAQRARRPDYVACPPLRGILGNTIRCTITDNGATFGITVTVTSVNGDDIGTHYVVDRGWPN